MIAVKEIARISPQMKQSQNRFDRAFLFIKRFIDGLKKVVAGIGFFPFGQLNIWYWIKCIDKRIEFVW